MSFNFIKCFLSKFWQPFYKADQDNLDNLGKGHHKENYCEIILNMDQ